MAISFQCTTCAKRLKVPDELAGKQARCPSCGALLVVPEALLEAEEAVTARPPADQGYGLTPVEEKPKKEERVPCPMCGEMILPDAVKCRYCGEIFDETLKRAEKKKSGGASDDTLSVAEILAAIFCSGIACIFGIVWMIQGKPKGVKMIGLSMLFSVIWSVVRFALIEGQRH
jgi:predicted RNA-binding Zn-ribbon protein involved in translation (DUF1610 family)